MTADITEIRRGIAAQHQPGAVIELRVPNAGPAAGTMSGYFDDVEKLAQAIARQDSANVYTTLNPVNPALLARCANHVKSRAKITTSDKDIQWRRQLLIDFDAVRPAGISATDVEHAAALERARDARSVLGEEYGWPAPRLGDSGNGAHLLYAIDLPNEDSTAELLKNVLRALAGRFDDGRVTVDQTVFNAARIVKAYGSVSRKGDSTGDRPHRLSRLLEVPLTVETVSREQLEALAATLTPSDPAQPSGARRQVFRVEDWLSRNGLAVRSPVSHQGGRKWVLEECPFNSEHKAPDAAVFEGPDGKPGFKCLHNSCAGYHWKELRERVEGPRPAGQKNGGRDTPRKTQYQSGRAVFQMEDPPVTPIIDRLFYPGFTLLTGRPKSGKSWLTLQAAMSVARGVPLAEWLEVPAKQSVVYVALEEPRQRTTARMRKLQRDGESVEDLDNIRFVYSIAPLLSGGVAELDTLLADWPAKLVVIDTVRAFARTRTKSSESIVEADYNVSSVLRELAEKRRCALVGVDHSRKASGDVIDAVIGTTGATAGCDSVIGLVRSASGDTVLTARGREHEELTYSMRFNGVAGDFGWRIFSDGDDAVLSEERRDILELLKDEAPLKPAKIALLLRKNANAVRRLLTKLVSDGKVTKQKDGYVLQSHW